jgi:bifunctional DNA-binding transcriptional regulator/antitoxin component of YhaV-PrlF toxin-antitoxin module
VHLQKQLSRRYGGKDYAKWLVVIPPNVVDKLGWAEGEELEARVEGHQLNLKRVRKPKGGP